MNELKQALESHDWLYQYADDFSKWTRGSEERKNINRLMKEAEEAGKGQEAQELYNQYKR